MLKNFYACVEKKDLLKQMVLSKLIAGQKDLMLGYVWWILEPLLFTLVYWLLVAVIFRRGKANYAVFVLCGLVPYRAFALSFGQSVVSVSSKFALMSQINFPRIFLPICDVIVNHIKLLFGFIVVIAFCLFSGIDLNYNVIYVVIPLSIQILLVSGLAMIASVLGVYFRDLKNIVQFMMRILLYISPVIYSIDRIPKRFHDIYLMNPIASLMITYKDVVIFGKTPDIKLMFMASVQSLCILVFGYIFFSNHQKKLLKFI